MKKAFIILFVLVVGFSAHAQSDLLLYNFSGIPQNFSVNPASPQQTKWYISLPAIGGVSSYFHNSGFKPSDLLEAGTDVNENLDNIINGLNERSQITAGNSINLLGFGFQTKKGFINFKVEQRTDVRFQYPIDLLKFVQSGNGSDDVLNFNSFNVEALTVTTAAVGYQHAITERLRVAATFKYLIGQSHAYTERVNASLYSSQDSLRADADILVRTSGVSAVIDDAIPFDIPSFALPDNSGMAFDFGIYYKLGKKFDFSASVLDIGSINWKTANRDYEIKGSYTFEGVEIDLGDDDNGSAATALGDSLSEAFKLNEIDGNSYSRRLMPRVFAGLDWNLNEKNTIGLVYHTRYWGDTWFHDYSVNYHLRLARMFQIMMNYSIVNETYDNIGLGFDLKLGPLQLFLLADNLYDIDRIAQGQTVVPDINSFNLHIGVNFTFYGKREKNKDKKPAENPVAPKAS